jgi:thiamine-phosphate pyrophosphorylase
MADEMDLPESTLSGLDDPDVLSAPISARYPWPAAPLLMLDSDRTRYGSRTLVELFLAAIAGGVNVVQLWEPDLPARDLLGEAQRLRKLALGGVPMLVYDRSAVALAAHADGVHLPPDGLPIQAAKHASQGLLVGRNVASVAEAIAAEVDGADYLVVGPVFFSSYAGDRTPTGPTLVRRIKARVHLPVLASGGITAGNAHQVIAAGADGVAVTTEILTADDPRQAAKCLLEAMRGAWDTRPLMRESRG